MFDDKTIAFTTGDFRRYGKSQDPESLFGKILLINIETKQYEFFYQLGIEILRTFKN